MKVKNIFESKEFVRDEKAKSLSFFCRNDAVEFNEEMLRQLIELSQKEGKRNARLCLHSSPNAKFHDMILVEYADSRYYRPHKHTDKGETIHIFEGKLVFLTFKDCGSIDKYFFLGEGGSLVCKVSEDCWHTAIPLTEYVVYHESKPGPFLGEKDSIYPIWTPEGYDDFESKKYMNLLLTAVLLPKNNKCDIRK